MDRLRAQCSLTLHHHLPYLHLLHILLEVWNHLAVLFRPRCRPHPQTSAVTARQPPAPPDLLEPLSAILDSTERFDRLHRIEDILQTLLNEPHVVEIQPPAQVPVIQRG
jgi:hypothetical protein